MSVLNEIRKLSDLYREINSLAKAGLVLLKKERVDDLFATWDRRRRVFARLNALGRRLEPVWRDWPASAGELDPDQRRQAEELILKIKRNAARTMEIDRQVAESVTAARIEIRQCLKRLNVGRSLTRAYRRRKNKQPSAPSRFYRMC
jgi:hypothetical protein